MNTRYIYGLIDPRTNVYFYVGQSKNPQKRLKMHYGQSHLRLKEPVGFDSHMYIYRLIKAGYRPILDVIEEVPVGLAYQLEFEWALTFKLLGHPITNRLTHIVKGKADFVKEQLKQFAA